MARPSLLVEHGAMRDAFRECYDWADQVRIAIAWARQSWPIEMLCSGRKPVESIVGTAFEMTCPVVIERLRELGVVRLTMGETTGLFHPKIYWFVRAGQHRAIIGSHNATRAAFEANEEASILIALDADMGSQLNELWERWKRISRAATPQRLEQYRARYARSKVRRQLAKAADLADHGAAEQEELPEGLLNAGWEDYVAALRAEYGDAEIEKCHLSTLQICAPLVASPFPPAGTRAFNQLIGAEPADGEIDTGWLGRLTGGGKATKLLGHDERLRKDIHQHLKGLIASQDEGDLLRRASRFFERINTVPGLAHATATRFLTLARPDRFFSVNGPSIRKLAGLLGMSQSRLRTAEGYTEALELVWRSPWCGSPVPQSKRDRQLHAARVALLDVIAYNPEDR